MSYIYLAGPYTFRQCERKEEIEHQRYLLHKEICWRYLEKEKWVYSPIVHCHPLAKVHKLPTDHTFWLAYNKAMIEPAKELHVIKFHLWELSKGTTEEIAYANEFGIPIQFVDPALYGVPNPHFTD